MSHHKHLLHGVMVEHHRRPPRTIRISHLLIALGTICAGLVITILWAGGAL